MVRSRLLVVGLACMVAAGCGQSTAGGPPGPAAVTFATVAAQPAPPISGGSATQRALLARIASHVGETSITALAIGTPPDGFNRSGDWLTVSLPPGDGPQNAMGEWQASLVAGAFTTESAARSLPPVSGFSETGGASVLTPHAGAFARPAPAAAIAARLEALGLSLDSVTAVHPSVTGVAYIVRATAAHPREFVRKRGEAAFGKTFGDLRRYEGEYLVVSDRRGQPIVIGWQASRVEDGSEWIDPRLAAPRSTSLSPFGASG